MRQARRLRRVGELVDVIDAGDKVVVIMRPPSEEGEQAALNANLTTFRDGKIIEMVHYPNPEDGDAVRVHHRRAVAHAVGGSPRG